MENTISMSSDSFEEFLRCLSILREYCSDADIREGIIRQRSNDSSSVFELDLTSILEDVSIPISGLKSQLDLLKMFVEHEVTLTVNQPEKQGENGWYLFSDEYSSLKFEMAASEYLDNKFMPEDEIQSVFDLKEEDLILSTDISGFISERMKIVSGGFNITNLEVDIQGEEATISTKTQAGDQTAKFIEGLVTDKVLECTSHMVITPFIIDHDGDIVFKMYNIQPTVSGNIFTTSIKDIDIKIYTRSTLMDKDE